MTVPLISPAAALELIIAPAVLIPVLEMLTLLLMVVPLISSAAAVTPTVIEPVPNAPVAGGPAALLVPDFKMPVVIVVPPL